MSTARAIGLAALGLVGGAAGLAQYRAVYVEPGEAAERAARATELAEADHERVRLERALDEAREQHAAEMPRIAVFRATATYTFGPVDVHVGDACTVEVERRSSSAMCRLLVACGTRSLYGGPGQGYYPCDPDRGDLPPGEDLFPSARDGDAQFGIVAGVLHVGDTEPDWSVDLAVAPEPEPPLPAWTGDGNACPLP